VNKNGNGRTPACPNGSLLVTRVHDAWVISPDQDVEAGHVDALDHALATASNGDGPVVVDLNGFRRLCAPALAVLASWNRRLAAANRVLAVCTSHTDVRFLLGHAGIQPPIRVHRDLGTAMRAFRPEATRPLGEILVSDFGLDRSSLMLALHTQKREGGLLGRILLTMHLVAAGDLMAALARQGDPTFARS